MSPLVVAGEFKASSPVGLAANPLQGSDRASPGRSTDRPGPAPRPAGPPAGRVVRRADRGTANSPRDIGWSPASRPAPERLPAPPAPSPDLRRAGPPAGHPRLP